MSGRRTSHISQSECFTESGEDAIFPVLTVNIGEDDIVFTVFREEIIELCRYIIDITGMLGLSYEARESFTTSETDGAFCRDSASEESDSHGIIVQLQDKLSEHS